MSPRRRMLLLFCLTVALLANDLLARVISYAPYTNRAATRSINHRQNRWFALIEAIPGQFGAGQLVLYDAKGLSEPRVIYPTDNSTRELGFALVS